MSTTKRIQQLAAIDRPREKLLNKGVASLSDYELLEVIIGSGNAGADVTYMARKVQKLLHKGTSHVNFETLTAIRGVHTATASRLIASLELARRYLVRDVEPLRTQEDILARLDEIRTKQQEHVVCMSLDGGQRLIALRTITIGTLDSVIVHPRELFADAITDRAASVVIAHNHPSNSAKPSMRDIEVTQQLVAAGQLLGISVRDHIIVTKTDQFSFRQHHYL